MNKIFSDFPKRQIAGMLWFCLALAWQLGSHSESWGQTSAQPAAYNPGTSPRQLPPDSRPNIIVIHLDDADRLGLEIDFHHPRSEGDYFPQLSQLAREGIRFSNAHCAVPFCNPSRACFFTGQYAFQTTVRHNNPLSPECRGVDGGFIPFRDRGPFGNRQNPFWKNEIGVWMRDAGYHTIHIGKYLHDQFLPGEGQTWTDMTPPGWEHFYGSYGASYFRNMFSRNGQISFAHQADLAVYSERYRTTIEGQDMVRLIQEHWERQDLRPFFIHFAPIAPHIEAFEELCVAEDQPDRGMVSNRYKHLWPDLKLPRTPDFDEEDVSDKPQAVRALRRLAGAPPESRLATPEKMDQEYRRRQLSLLSVDESLGRLRAALDAHPRGRNTIIFITSDHGFQIGHQRHFGKVLPYDRVTNIPLWVWGPALLSSQGQVKNHLISNIDFAPTFLELAQVDVPREVQGRSLVPLLTLHQSPPAETWRPEGVLVESWGHSTDNQTSFDHSCLSLRQYQEVFTQWATGEREYYDLAADPHQLQNQISNLSTEAAQQFEKQIRAIKRPLPSPLAFIAVPNFSARVFQGTARLEGLAESGDPLHGVEIEIQDGCSDPVQYWNGSAWQDTPCVLAADLENAGGLISNWSYLLAPNYAADLDLSVRARAVTCGDKGEALTRGPWSVPKRMVMTQRFPLAQITAPNLEEAQRFLLPIPLQGIFRRTEQLESLKLILKNEKQLFWNGKGWQAEPVELDLTTSSLRRETIRWSYTFQPTEKAGHAYATLVGKSLSGAVITVSDSERIRWLK